MFLLYKTSFVPFCHACLPKTFYDLVTTIKLLLRFWLFSPFYYIYYVLHVNSIDGEVIPESGIRFRPPSGFTDSREFSEAECDRDRALDLEVQRVMEQQQQQQLNGQISGDSELTSLLAR